MTLQPETIGNQLIGKLNSLRTSNQDISAFEIAAIRREAKKLLDVDAFHAYVVLGAIACVEGDIEAMIENHEKALRISYDDDLALRNYASSLGQSWMIDEQVNIFERMITSNIAPLFANRAAAFSRELQGNYEDAKKYAEKYLELEQSRDDTHQIELIITVCQLIKDLGIPSVDVSDYAQAAIDVMKNNRVHPEYVDYFQSPDNELIRSIVVDVDVDRVSEMNDQFAFLLSQQSFSKETIRYFGASFVKGEADTD